MNNTTSGNNITIGSESNIRFDNALANAYRSIRPYFNTEFQEGIFDGFILLIAVGIIGLSLSLSGIGCPIELISGWNCPICGMTRAWMSFLTLDIINAFAYHPLFWCVPLSCFLIGQLVHAETRKWRDIIILSLIAIIAAFIILYVVRMLIPNDMMLIPFNNIGEDICHISSPRFSLP